MATNYERVAWRPFWTFHQEESGTMLHLAEKGSPKTLCGKRIPRDDEYASQWANSPAISRMCKRCRNSGTKHGLDKQTINALPWASVR